MAEVNGNNQCPICEQIVPSQLKERVMVRISPARTVVLHEGCAKLASHALYDYYHERNMVEEE